MTKLETLGYFWHTKLLHTTGMDILYPKKPVLHKVKYNNALLSIIKVKELKFINGEKGQEILY